MNTELTKIINTFHQGDCLEVLPTLPDACVDLIVTSPPYADSRKDTYGGVLLMLRPLKLLLRNFTKSLKTMKSSLLS